MEHNLFIKGIAELFVGQLVFMLDPVFTEIKNTKRNFPVSFSPHRFGQFISSTLPTFAVCEKFVVMEINNEEKIDGGNNKLCVFLYGNG